MKYTLIFVIGLFAVSCGMKVPYTNQVREDFSLDTNKQLKKVQFYTSATIILEKSKSSQNQETSGDGALVTSSNKNSNRIIIPAQTKCIFDDFGPNGETGIRFEMGAGKVLYFNVRPNQTSGKYYMTAEWTADKGGKITYGEETFYISSFTGNTYLLVKMRKLQKTKRKDRVVKGLKV